jgi:hypothetical protein
MLFNASLSNAVVPTQWKTALITPVPKVSVPKSNADFRPISLTPILSRVLEKFLVRRVFYPLLQQPTESLLVDDQYAFQPTGSTTAALIAMLHSITEMVNKYGVVQVVALDFSKAFDTVRHCTLMDKFSQTSMPDNIYNWLVSYLSGRDHCTKYNGVISSAASINASVVQGSALGPLAFLICSSDLRAKTPGNKVLKYADDSYLLSLDATPTAYPMNLCRSGHGQTAII